MAVMIYTEGRHGTEPLDKSRCRAWAVNRGGQCVNRPTGKFQGQLLCGVHRRQAERKGLALRPGRFFYERQNDPPTIGRDITREVYSIDGKRRKK